MVSHERIGVVMIMYTAGKIHSFSDVFLYLPPTPLASFTRIARSKFRDTSSLWLKDIIAFSKFFNIPTQTVFQWATIDSQPQQKPDYSLSDNDALRIDIINDRIALGKLHRFAQLFEILPRTTVAGLLKLNNDRVAEMLFCPDTINVKTMTRFAHFFQIEPALVFRLIENEWLANAKLPINHIKPTVKLLNKKMTA